MELGYSQRTISPYASPPITLLLGRPSEPQARYAIPKSLLTAFPTSQVVHSHHPCESVLPLPDVSPDIGHTLVHYLHTGHYETLSSSTDSLASYYLEYQRAARIYSTARVYTLPELASLAQSHIVRFSTLLSPAQILEVTREVYPSLTDDHWFRVYMESIIINACRDDGHFLVSDAFLSAFGKGDDIRFDRLLMQIALDVAVKIARESEERDGSAAGCFPFRDFRANGTGNSTANGDSHSHWRGSSEDPAEDLPRESLYGVNEGMWERVEEEREHEHEHEYEGKRHIIHESSQPGEESSELAAELGPEPGQEREFEQRERDSASCYGPVKEPENGVVPEERLLDSMDRPVLDEPETQHEPVPEVQHALDREPSLEPGQMEQDLESRAEQKLEHGLQQESQPEHAAIIQEEPTEDTIPLGSPVEKTLPPEHGPEPGLESGPAPSTETPSPLPSHSTSKKKKKNKKKKKKTSSAETGDLPNLINV